MTDSVNAIVPASLGDEESNSKRNKWMRGAINAAGGAIPFAGGFLSAAAGVWGSQKPKRQWPPSGHG